MLPSARFCDDALLAHASAQQHLRNSSSEQF
jgi:hypothetical protein